MDESEIKQLAERLVEERASALEAVFHEILRSYGGDPTAGKPPPTEESGNQAVEDMLALLSEIEVQEQAAAMFAGLDALREVASRDNEPEDDEDVR